MLDKLKIIIAKQINNNQIKILNLLLSDFII